MKDLLTKAKQTKKAPGKWDRWCKVSLALIKKGYTFEEIGEWLRAEGEKVPDSFVTSLSHNLSKRGLKPRASK